MKNDLELIAISQYPKLKILKNFLTNSSNNGARMTGSGSAILLILIHQKCKDTEKKVKKN